MRAFHLLFQLDPVPDADAGSTPLFDYRSTKDRRLNKPRHSSRAHFSKWITTLFAASGINDTLRDRKLTSHSFRHGAAHTLAAAGVDGPMLKTAGRWRSDAWTVYTEHLKSNPAILRDLTLTLANAKQTRGLITGWTPPC